MSQPTLMARAAPFLTMLLIACSERAALKQSPSATPDDSAFAQVQTRGHVAMGVDQYPSTHHFEPLPDGGRIELQRDRDDSAGVHAIRAHLHAIAKDLVTGYRTPGVGGSAPRDTNPR